MESMGSSAYNRHPICIHALIAMHCRYGTRENVIIGLSCEVLSFVSQTWGLFPFGTSCFCDPPKVWQRGKWMHILGPLPLIMGGGNQYAQLVDNGSASGNNSCQGEQAPTGGQKNGSLIRQKIEEGIFIKKFFYWRKLMLYIPRNGQKRKTLEMTFSHNRISNLKCTAEKNGGCG